MHLFVQPLFQFRKEDGAPLLLQKVRSQLDNKITGTEPTMIEHIQDHRIHHDWPEFFHQIKRQGWTPLFPTHLGATAGSHPTSASLLPLQQTSLASRFTRSHCKGGSGADVG